MKMYAVGGYVRDEILGIPSKDIDFSVVFEEKETSFLESNKDELTPFDVMVHELQHRGFRIFLETPEYLTVRAQFPVVKDHEGDFNPLKQKDYGLTADFVLARKESDYTDGRRPDTVEPGTLLDDLARRDFRMNAIAKDTDGSYIDPFNGRADIDARIIRAVGDPLERLTEDALRVVRALRFSVTKGFDLDKVLKWELLAADFNGLADALRDNINDDRIREELSKMFRYDTVASLQVLNQFPDIMRAIFAGDVSLDATMKTKGRNK